MAVTGTTPSTAAPPTGYRGQVAGRQLQLWSRVAPLRWPMPWDRWRSCEGQACTSEPGTNTVFDQNMWRQMGVSETPAGPVLDGFPAGPVACWHPRYHQGAE
jgi:hypothetical protein